MGEIILEFIFEKIIPLPVYLTQKSKYRPVRIIGAVLFCLWVVPITFFVLPLIIIGLFIYYIDIICSE